MNPVSILQKNKREWIFKKFARPTNYIYDTPPRGVRGGYTPPPDGRGDKMMTILFVNV
jgi:hypothetical protein